jgi:hypothetical protein
MKFKGKVNLGEVNIPMVIKEEVQHASLKNITVEYETEFTITEMTGVIDALQKAPDMLIDMVRKFRAAEEEFTPKDIRKDIAEDKTIQKTNN